jgi:hypothetical protein
MFAIVAASNCGLGIKTKNCCGMSSRRPSVSKKKFGALILLLGQNQIQEATVVSTGYSGQFGGAAGGNINYLTKSGGNEFHGNVQYYWNGRVFNANNWFNKGFDEPRPFSIANQWNNLVFLIGPPNEAAPKSSGCGRSENSHTRDNPRFMSSGSATH